MTTYAGPRPALAPPGLWTKWSSRKQRSILDRLGDNALALYENPDRSLFDTFVLLQVTRRGSQTHSLSFLIAENEWVYSLTTDRWPDYCASFGWRDSDPTFWRLLCQLTPEKLQNARREYR